MNCRVCKRPLTDPTSIKRGMGEICAGHAGSGNGDDVAKRVSFADMYNDQVPFSTAFVMARAGKATDADSDRYAITNVPHLVVHHSPNGFDFGYAGSAPADLALNAVQLYLNQVGYTGAKTKCYDGSCWTMAWMLHQEFKRAFTAIVPHAGATIPFEKIDTWMCSHMTAELLERCEDLTQYEITEE